MSIEGEIRDIRKRTRKAIIGIIESIEKAKLVGVSYGSLEKKYDRGIRVMMTSATIRDIYKIMNIIKSQGLSIENIHIYELNRLVAIEVFFDKRV
jgi:hypothetical protein